MKTEAIPYFVSIYKQTTGLDICELVLLPFSALGIEAFTGLVANACRRMSGKPARLYRRERPE